jgi:hypothetical protein
MNHYSQLLACEQSLTAKIEYSLVHQQRLTKGSRAILGPAAYIEWLPLKSARVIRWYLSQDLVSSTIRVQKPELRTQFMSRLREEQRRQSSASYAPPQDMGALLPAISQDPVLQSAPTKARCNQKDCVCACATTLWPAAPGSFLRNR